MSHPTACEAMASRSRRRVAIRFSEHEGASVERTMSQGDDDELNIFSFIDYRAFLKAHYEHRKRRSKSYSYRLFSRLAKVKSPNYLKLVIDGQRNLSPDMAERFAKACKLDDEAAEYFVDLVAFNQAPTTKERDRLLTRLARFRGYRQAHQLDLRHAEYHRTWYLPAICELASRADFNADPEHIAAELVPAISVEQARDAVALLVELDLLAPDDEGRLRRTEAVLTTGSQTSGVHIANFHRSMLERASDAIDDVPAAERDISSITMCVSAERLQLIRKRVAELRKELIEIAVQDPEPQRVIQVNLQIFPLSK